MDTHPPISPAAYFLTKSGSYIVDINEHGQRLDKKNGVYRSLSSPSGNGKDNDFEQETNETIFFNDAANPRNEDVMHASRKYSRSSKLETISSSDSEANEAEDVKPEQDPQADTKLKFSKLSKRSKYTFIMLAIANFGAGCGFSLPAPFYPREAEIKGASPTAIGLVFSSFQLVNFIAAPLFGNYLTQLGAKFVYTSGIMVAGTTAILFGFLDQGPSGTIFVVMSFLVRSIEALGVSAFSTASFAIISNEFPQHIASVFATLETCLGIGLMVGPTIGGALYEVGGFGLPFWVVGAIIVISGLAIFTCLPAPTDTTEKRQGTVFTLLKSPMVWVTMLCVMVGSCGFGFLDPTLSNHLDQFGLSTLAVGLFFVIVPFLHAILAPFWGFLSDRKDIQSPLLVGGSFLCAIGFLFMGPAPFLPFLPRELWTVTVGLVFYGVSIGCAIVPTMKCLVIGAREIGLSDNLNTFGLVAGLFNSIFCLGAFVGPTIGGALVDQIGFYYGSTIIAAFYFVSMVVSAIFFTLRRIRRKKIIAKGGTSDDNTTTSDEMPINEKSPLITADSTTKALDSSYSSASFSQMNAPGSTQNGKSSQLKQ
uniref:Major facilitator superfamily (MFS) profile domain-containing protein n=1 Tax=Arion vulgaris TaxID=1028688 RepID=A0A0B7AZM1_9EUPU